MKDKTASITSPIQSRTKPRLPRIAVLFVRKNTIYRKFQNLDLFDEVRDAKTFTGSAPVIAHPPCRGWGRLRGLSNATEAEKDLARFAIETIRANGGVLEHPESSSLWSDMNLPLGNGTDLYGGWTLSVDQKWFGHKARKRTWLYIVGISRTDIPPYPLCFDATTHEVTKGRKKSGKKQLSKAGRMATPVKFAEWLIRLAQLIALK